uniref:Uncharacterized protein n=1 Tax=Glossina austeni TaxID=7395 RepID=A0A1A9VQF2_GLOAU
MFFLEQLPVVSLKQWSHIVVITILLKSTKSSVFFTKHGSFGYLAAVAMPLDLPNRNVYVAFNFEANYGLPSNDSYHEWIDRWNLDNEFLGIDNNVTAIDGRKMVKSKRILPHQPPYYGRHSFYQTFVGYLNYFHMNGTACLLRTICEIASSNLDENNGVLGSIFKILFMPTTSARETLSSLLLPDLTQHDLYLAEYRGSQSKTQTDVTTDNHMDTATNCLDYVDWCPQDIINMISTLY